VGGKDRTRDHSVHNPSAIPPSYFKDYDFVEHFYSFITETNTRYHRCLTSGPPAPRWPNIGLAAHHTSSGRQCHGPAAAASGIYNLGRKKWGEGGIRTQATETRLQHLTTALRSLC
jgi:hypothetical protein